MLQEILDLNTSVLVLVCYVPDISVLTVIKQYVMKKHDINTNYMETVDDVAKLKYVYRDALITPMLGDKWYIEVNLDKVAYENVLNIAENVNENSISICYTTNYGTYKRLVENQRLHSNNSVFMLYGGRLSAKDIYYTHEELRKQGACVLSDKLLNYVIHNYRNDVVKYFEILHKLRSGVALNSRASIVSAVGLGSLTVLSFTVDILTSELNTERSKKAAIRRWMQSMNDLLHDMDVNTLLKQMKYACIDIRNYKMLQMQGLVVGNKREITDEKVAQGVNRLRRFEDQICEKVPLVRVLWLLRTIVETRYIYTMPEELLLHVLYKYVAMWQESE